ncbi:MAG: HAMP domain-containing sensor histidine kinase [Campylobacterota bacterium]|nr:HAMP domain-containing sensor histidine kinase [Campylobacterota bacterium]
MKNYEKYALIKFTSIYFFSIAIFIISLGYLYHEQQKNTILQNYTMKMHQYVMKLKQSNFTYVEDGYSFKIVDKNYFKYQLITKENNKYKKTFPSYKSLQFIVVFFDTEKIDASLLEIKTFTIILQLLLLLLFFNISLYLAKLSLKPMKDIISHLDRFIKDLIHDLNTPITSIKLNTKMLKKQIEDENLLKKLQRIENSTETIDSLYENLEVILQNKLHKENVNLFPILEEKKELCSFQYPNIKLIFINTKIEVLTHKKAITRILDNILTNAYKYAKVDSTIEISFNQKTLTIKDNGKGMKYPEKIFERSYSENENGHGIGMHIVQRLCDNLDIQIDIDSKENIGTIVSLKF